MTSQKPPHLNGPAGPPATLAYDPARVAAYYDTYGEREWTRFEVGPSTTGSLAVHCAMLRRFVRPGDRVLDVGAGPGRFTIELARIGADIVVADLSPGQLDLNRAHVAQAGCEERVIERAIADVTDLMAFLSWIELELAEEPGAIGAGDHMIAVLRKNA